MDYSQAAKALSFFIPRFRTRAFLGFYGGEPLLCFGLIEDIVRLAKEKKREFNKRIQFSLTTNGSLLTEAMMDFLNQYRFHIELSFDGYAQNLQRQDGSFEAILTNIEKVLKHKNIHLETNSVFTPDSIELLYDSILLLIDLGVPNIRYSLSTIRPWNQIALDGLSFELNRLKAYLAGFHKKKRTEPVVNFRTDRKKGIFFCSAGQDRLALTPDGKIWGCYLFPEYFEGKEHTDEYKKFSFGSLSDFMDNHAEIYPKIFPNYTELSMDNFETSKTKCFFCSNLENCTVCPVNAAFSSGRLGRIPSRVCEVQKRKQEVKEMMQGAIHIFRGPFRRSPKERQV